MRIRPALLAALVLLLAFGAVTLVALEGKGVAVLHTGGTGDAEHRTRVWFAEDEGALWVEAATAERPFYLDLQAGPDFVLEVRDSPFDRKPRLVRGHAELIPEPGGHRKIRSLLAAKYGWADAWIALLQDTSSSRAVRVVVER